MNTDYNRKIKWGKRNMYLKIKVVPDSKMEKVEKLKDDEYRIWVKIVAKIILQIVGWLSCVEKCFQACPYVLLVDIIHHQNTFYQLAVGSNFWYNRLHVETARPRRCRTTSRFSTRYSFIPARLNNH